MTALDFGRDRLGIEINLIADYHLNKNVNKQYENIPEISLAPSLSNVNPSRLARVGTGGHIKILLAPARLRVLFRNLFSNLGKWTLSSLGIYGELPLFTQSSKLTNLNIAGNALTQWDFLNIPGTLE